VQRTSRSRIGSVVGIIGAIAVSCQGTSGCFTAPGGGGPPPAPPVLASRYVLVRVQPANTVSAAIPAFYADSAGYRLRADADTLFFASDSTYREVGQTTLVSSTGTETVRPQATGTPAPRYANDVGSGGMKLPIFMGRQASFGFYGQQLTVYTYAGSVQYGGPVFLFESR
jgi:hypothetical protein